MRVGLRGPIPMSPSARALRQARGRPPIAARFLDRQLERLLLARAEALHRLGLRLLKRAERRPSGRTPSNGEQASPLFGAAHRCFEAADRIYLRLGRLMPDARDEESSAADADPLEIFRRAKH